VTPTARVHFHTLLFEGVFFEGKEAAGFPSPAAFDR
jgi:hypothetical protein